MGSSFVEKADSTSGKDVQIQHVDAEGHPTILASDVGETKVFNFMLILACITFAAPAILFGYDDKVISPVAAMEQFVSIPTYDFHP